MVFTEEQRILSLCTGYGGIEEGITSVSQNIRTVAYVEIEAFAIQNLLNLMEAGILDPAPLFSNVKTFPGRTFRNKIHGIVGGYPCQPFSHAGARGGKEDPRHLWPHIRRIIKTTGPIWCFFENVEGHLSLGYEEVYRSLRDLGYKVEAGIFSAVEVGAPHRRKRLFILAVANQYYERWKAGTGEPAIFNQTGRWMGQGWDKMEDPESICGGLRESDQRKSDINSERTSKKLGNSPGHNKQGNRKLSRKPKIKAGGSGNVANTNCNRNGRSSCSCPLGKDRLFGDEKENRPDRRSKIERCCTYTELADSEGKRMEECRSDREQITQAQIRKEILGCNSTGIWPARPESQQYEWEFDRSITKDAEPGLGITVNGYSFREDLLRLLGNGVVPQTAAKAFIELVRKI